MLSAQLVALQLMNSTGQTVLEDVRRDRSAAGEGRYKMKEAASKNRLRSSTKSTETLRGGQVLVDKLQPESQSPYLSKVTLKRYGSPLSCVKAVGNSF